MSITSEGASEALSISTTTSNSSKTSSKTIFYISSVLILPVLYAFTSQQTAQSDNS
jgi:hypothetical protein